LPKFEALQKRFDDDSSKTSAGIRNLALSGLGSLWVVTHTDKVSKIVNTQNLNLFKWAAFSFIAALLFDLTHYFATSISYWAFLKKLQRDFDKDQVGLFNNDHDLPRHIKGIPWFFYIAKGLSLIAAAILFLIALTTIHF